MKKAISKTQPTIHIRPWVLRHPLAGVILVVVVVMAIYDRVRPLAPSANLADDYITYHEQTYRVVNIVDGDTFDIDVPDGDSATTRVRLWGVDTPEKAGSRDGAMYFGAEATDYARDTLHNRSVYMVLSPLRTRGLYGRLLAYVYLERDGLMFNEMLLDTGHAYADMRFEHHYRDRFESIEQHARKTKTGLWAGVTLEDMPEWKQSREKE